MLAGLTQLNGIAYLPNAAGTAFERYDVTNERWLQPVVLAGSPGGLTASNVDADGLYAAFGTSVYRYRLDGSSATLLTTTTYPVQAIHSDGNLLFVNQTLNYNGRILSIDKATNAVVASRSVGLAGSSILPASNRIVGRSMGFSPSAVTYVDYDDAGRFVAKYLPQEPYSDQSAMRTWASPSGGWFADDSGTVYSPSTLDLAGSFGTRIDDLTFTPAGTPVALYGGTLTSFASQTSLRPTGSATLAAPATWVSADADDAFAFAADASVPHGYSVQVVPLADFELPQPGAPIDARDRVYAPDDVEVAGDGTVLLLSKADKSIFRFDPETLEYLPTIPLVGEPSSMAYVPTHNAVYVGYASGRIDKIDLSVSAGSVPAERPFAALAGAADNMAAAGGFLFTSNRLDSSRVAYSTFDADGTSASLKYGDLGADFQYASSNGKIYFVGTYSSPRYFESVEISAAGKLGAIARRSGPGNVEFWQPVSVSPDGATVLLGSGHLLDANTLQSIMVYDSVYGYDVPAMLGNRVAGIARSNGDTYTIRDLNGGTQFQRWAGSSYAATTVAATAPGDPLSIQTIGGGRLLGIFRSKVGVPVFRVMDAQLRTLGETTPPPPAPLENATIDVTVSGSPVEGSGTLRLYADASNLGYGQSITRVEYDFDYDGATFDSSAAFTPPGTSSIDAYVVDMPYTVADGPSTRTIALRVTDTFGQTAIRTRTIAFANVPPTATLTASSDDPADHRSVTYSFANVKDAAADVAAGFRYSFDFNNDGDFDDVGDVADSASPSATFRWATPGTYVVRGRIVDKDGGASLYVNSTVVSDDTNLASGKPTTAIGSVAGYPPSNATDASPDTEWVAPASDTGWLQVDLGAFYRVTSLVAVFNRGAPDSFQVLTSTNASTWMGSVYSRAGNTDATSSISLQNATAVARYVRLQFTKRNATTSYRVGDLRVYGVPAKPPAPTYVYWGPLSPLNEGATASLGGTTFPLADGQTIAKWEWDYDYDGTTFDVDATGQTVQVSLPDSGLKRLVAIRATDNYGQAVIGRGTLSPINVAPTAKLTSSASSMTATATFSNVTDPSAADVAAGFRYSFDFNNDGDFADAGDVLNSLSSSASYAFAQPGTYAIHGRVADKDGGFTDYTTSAVLTAPAPPPPPGNVSFDYSASPTEGGPPITLLARTSIAAGQSIAKYEWDFDYVNGTFTTDYTSPQNAFIAGAASYDYSAVDGPASPKVALRVTDNFGQVVTVVQAVPIANVAPTATLDVVGGAGKATATLGGATDVSAADRAAGFKYSFDFNNDGDFLDPGEVDRGTSPTATGTYTTAGTYTVLARVYDKDGDFSKYLATVTVTTPPTPTPAPLTGTPIGTAGSIGGNGIAKAFDGSLATYVDLAGSGPYAIGLDLGVAKQIASVKFAPRATLARRITGGVFQASNSATFATGVVTLGTIATQPADGVLTTLNFAASTATYRYVRYLAPAGSFGNVAELQFFGAAGTTTPPVTPPVVPPTTPVKLTGTGIGTAGSIGGNGFAKALDGDLTTYVDSSTVSGAFAGLDLGTAKVVRQIKFAPRATLGRRMVGGYFQASNVADFSVATTLFTIATAPPDGLLTSVDLTNATAFRYVRYVAPANSFGNVAEVQFYG